MSRFPCLPRPVLEVQTPAPRARRGARADHAGVVLLALVAASGLAACSRSSSDATGGDATSNQGPSGPPPPSVAEAGGEAAPPLAPGTVVARLTTELPVAETFLLRGTIPVPKGTFPRADGLLPFTIYDFDGTPLETQTELVSRYPHAADGADVVEVIARVRRDPALIPGTWTEYEVRDALRTHTARSSGTPAVDELRDVANVTPSVEALLDDPRALEITAYDCFGNAYVCYPLDGTGTLRTIRHGAVHSELRVYQTMLPETPVEGARGTLPHLFGVHAYVSTFRGDDLVGLDLRFHNGHAGHDKDTTEDDPLGKVYFQRIDVSFPEHWSLSQAFEDPMFGAMRYSGGRKIVSLVEPNRDGTMHVMDWQYQMHRRLMLSTADLDDVAREYVSEGAGQAFCVRGDDPATGNAYWSWWNRATARYFPQKFQLPQLDFLGLNAVRGGLAGRLGDLAGHLVEGTSTGQNYPVPATNLGWAHPYGTSYGGMTGGNEIFLYDGLRTAYAGARDGTQYFKALLRMHTDRQSTAFYDLDGQPTSVETWLVANAYTPFEHYVNPIFHGNDPFGRFQAPTFQVDYVEGVGLAPAYEASLAAYDPHDYQHYIRYTRGAKVLTWLANDSLSKDELRMQAENFRLGYHHYENNRYGNVQVTGLLDDMQFVARHPGTGFTFGRGEAWGVDCAVAAYAVADLEWRKKVAPWFLDVVRVLNDGQAACSGFIQANVTPKNFNGQYRTRQTIEQSITENMLQGLRETVLRDVSTALSDLVRDILVDSLYGFVSEMNFVPGKNVPAEMSAVGPLDPSLPVWCSFEEMPPGTWLGASTYMDWCSFAWGYELTNDPIFLQRAHAQAGGDVITMIETSHAYSLNIENQAALLALLQRQNGTL